jgi:hypothetical protein
LRYSAGGADDAMPEAGVIPAACCGMCGGSASCGSGGFAIIRNMYQVPAPKTAK